MLNDASCCMTMESPHMYDLSDAVVKADFAGLNGALNVKNGKLSSTVGGYGDDFGELTDLGASEVSLDLQSFVADQQFSDAIFTDIVDHRSPLLPGPGSGGGLSISPPSSAGIRQSACSASLAYVNSYLPPPASGAAAACSQRASLGGISLKKEPDSTVFVPSRGSTAQSSSPHNAATAGFHAGLSSVYNAAYGGVGQTTVSPGASTHQSQQPPPPLSSNLVSQTVALLGRSAGAGGKHSSGKRQDRSTDEYRRRRERNNVAVRKSREKAKLRSMETEERVKYLARENDALQKRIEVLAKELNVLKNLFANVGVLPDQLQREINKQLGEGYCSMRPSSSSL